MKTDDDFLAHEDVLATLVTLLLAGYSTTTSFIVVRGVNALIVGPNSGG